MMMQDAGADTTSRLVELLDRIRIETDQVRSDQLASEIRAILEVREVNKQRENLSDACERKSID